MPPPSVKMLLCLAMLACTTPPASGPTRSEPAATLVSEQAVVSGQVGRAVADAGEEGEPCGAAFTTNTRVSIPAGTILIDHFDGRDLTERIVVASSDVAGLEYERRADAAGRCSAIWLVRSDGRRVLFDDDELDLEVRARRLAEMLEVPLQVTRPDSPARSGPAAGSPRSPSPPSG